MIEIDKLKFDAHELIPCIVQDASSNKVLMLGYMNASSIQKTVADKRVTFYSRSKQRLWTKGETSGNYLELVDLLIDCDQDTLLAKVNPAGPVCHTGTDTCFKEDNKSFTLSSLENIIKDRKANPKEGSYTNQLLEGEVNKVAQKVGEEAVELILESKDDNEDLFLNESADLLYHFLVLLQKKGFSLNRVEEVLEKRHGS